MDSSDRKENAQIHKIGAYSKKRRPFDKVMLEARAAEYGDQQRSNAFIDPRNVQAN
jgi:hypothetical protein